MRSFTLTLTRESTGHPRGPARVHLTPPQTHFSPLQTLKFETPHLTPRNAHPVALDGSSSCTFGGSLNLLTLTLTLALTLTLTPTFTLTLTLTLTHKSTGHPRGPTRVYTLIPKPSTLIPLP